jgi:hypothetical protein
MGEWMKTDANLTVNAKVRHAGYAAGWVYLTCLGINRIGNRNGALPAHESTVDFLVYRSGMPKRVLETALARCFEGEKPLLVRREDGGITIRGYDETWRPATSSARTKRWREKGREGEDSDDCDVTCDARSVSRDAPTSHVTPRERERVSDRRNERTKRPTPSPSRAGSGRSSGRQVAGVDETDLLLAKIRGETA